MTWTLSDISRQRSKHSTSPSSRSQGGVVTYLSQGMWPVSGGSSFLFSDMRNISFLQPLDLRLPVVPGLERFLNDIHTHCCVTSRLAWLRGSVRTSWR